MKVLMVCLGNICRSPLAEGSMLKWAQEKGLDIQVDSAGTSAWHEGEPPHRESILVAREHGISIQHQRSRPVSSRDLDEFDIILAMDQSNRENLLKICTNDQQKHKVQLLLSISPSLNKDVPDPYYEGGFDGVFDMINHACERWLDFWLSEKKLNHVK